MVKPSAVTQVPVVLRRVDVVVRGEAVVRIGELRELIDEKFPMIVH